MSFTGVSERLEMITYPAHLWFLVPHTRQTIVERLGMRSEVAVQLVQEPLLALRVEKRGLERVLCQFVNVVAGEVESFLCGVEVFVHVAPKVRRVVRVQRYAQAKVQHP